jgi:hypothetical protein
VSRCSQNGAIVRQAALLVTAAPVSIIAVENGLSTKHLNKLLVWETID